MPTIIKEEMLADIKKSLYSNFTSAQEAMHELIDNSVAHRITGKKMEIKIFLIPSTNKSLRKIEILDVGGEGMTIEDLNDYFKWGKQKQRTGNDIGKYGQGGKAAIGYLGQIFKLTTSPVGDNFALEVEDRDLYEGKFKTYKAEKRKASHEEGYTRLIIEKVEHPLTQSFQDKLRDSIARYYKPLLESGVVEIKVNTEKIIPAKLPLDPNFKEQEFSFDVSDHKEVTKIHGWVGRQIGGRSGVRGGIRVYYKGRLITEKEYFGHPDPTKKQTLNFLIGEVFINDVVHPNMNKTDFNKSTDAYKSFQGQMHKILKPHIDELYRRTVDEPTHEEKENLRKVKEIAFEALKLMKQNHMLDDLDFEADEGTKTPQPREKKIEPIDYLPPKRENKPRTPAPPNASGRRKRLNNFIDWQLRNMGESIRSTIEERNIGTKKSQLLIINKDFPGYTRTNGNELYLLETFALQMVPMESDDVPYRKFLEEFDRFFGVLCSYIDEAKANMIKKKRG